MSLQAILGGRTLLDRCFAVQWLVLPFNIAYWFACEYVLRWGAADVAVNLDVVATAQRVVLVYGLAWLLLMVVTFMMARRENGESEGSVVMAALADNATGPALLVAHLTVQLFALSNVYATYLLGPVTSPFMMVLMGSGLVALLIFPPRVAWGAVGTGILSLLLCEVLRLVGVLPYAPLLHTPYGPPRVSSFWTVLMWSTVLPSGLLLFSLFNVLLVELRRREHRLRELTRTDALTALANRRHFADIMRTEFARAVRYDHPLCCVMIDLDHFKRINDTHGHAAGDAVLQEVATRLESELRESDLLARYGGEEFAAVLPDTGVDGARQVAERCRVVVEREPVLVDGVRIPVTASFGVATMTRERTPDAEKLLKAADDALYAAKDAGRNRVSLSGVEDD